MNMDTPQKTGQVVFTNKARCRDCYRCLRACPVKAIRMNEGQASVVEELCIACGTCIRECPQGAKSFRNDIERAVRLLEGGEYVAASLAPSYVAAFRGWERRRIASALRKLGFSYVAETAIGAYMVAAETAELLKRNPQQGWLASACPAVVSYVEQCAPDLVDKVVPIVSPMLAHAKAIREHRGANARIVFIGPCVAKKAEAQRPENKGLVDCVLTFSELREWFEREGIELAQCEESDFDEEPQGDARYFPLPGGLMRTAAIQADLLAQDCVAVSGVRELEHVLDGLRNNSGFNLVEPLFCMQGCVTGPGMPDDAGRNAYQDRSAVIDYAQIHKGLKENSTPRPNLRTRFASRKSAGAHCFTEEEIRQAMEEAGKAAPEDQLNCGACGYPTCRDKVIANLLGMAEPEMCVPYMRRLAEQRTDRIISTSPNGILILDEHLNVLGMNPAFKQMFMCSDAVLGKPVSYLMDPAPFEKLEAGREEVIDMVSRYSNYSLVCHQKLYPLREEKQYVGIFINITKTQENEQELSRLRSDTVVQAKELLEHQVRAAQEMVKFLGESTARGEVLVRNLLRVVDAEEKPGRENAAPAARRSNPWDTPISR